MLTEFNHLKASESVEFVLITTNKSLMKKCLHRKRRLDSERKQPSCCVWCQDVLKDLVSTSCGHWFCRRCITSDLVQSTSPGDSSCPQCGGKIQKELDCG